MSYISPKRVWAQGFERRHVLNLFPVTYEQSAENVQAQLAYCETQIAGCRRLLHIALKSRDQVLIRSFRRQIDRYASYARNCRQRLRQLGALS